MSESRIAEIITFAVVVSLVLWVPTLHLLQRLRNKSRVRISDEPVPAKDWNIGEPLQKPGGHERVRRLY